MNKKQELAQFLWIGLKGPSLSQEEKSFLTDHAPGGVILFTRNYESPEQLHSLNQEIQNLCLTNGFKTPAFIGIDMEGGRVQRLKEPFTVWPSMKQLAKHNSTSMAFDFSYAMGQELKSVGININFSPCTDSLLNKDNEVIGDRAFSNDPEEVGRYASAVIRGFKKAGILTCVKHFPGHGYSSVDSHESLPIDNRELHEINDIEAFKKALRTKPEFLMPGHLMFPKVDPDYPVPLSEKWVKDILLKELNCRAFLISDDLEMGALNGFNFEEMVLRVYNLGFHQMLFCHGHEKALNALETLAKNIEVDSHRLNQVLDCKSDHSLLTQGEFDNSFITNQEHKDLANKIKDEQHE